MPKDSAEAPPSEDGRGESLPWDTYTRADQGLINSGWMDLAKNVAYMQAAQLQGVTVKRKLGAWLAIVKVVRYGNHLAAFVDGRSFEACLDMVAYLSAHGSLRFWPDKHPYQGTEVPPVPPSP